MHVGSFVRGLGQLRATVYVPTTERANRRYPLVLTTGRILSQYNVGAQTRRTPNSTWHPEDILEIHPSDAELRGVASGDVVELSSRVGPPGSPRWCPSGCRPAWSTRRSTTP